MAVLTITCRLFCAGSRQTLAFTTFITYAVESLAIGYLMCCGIIRSWLLSVELRCFKVYGACEWLVGREGAAAISFEEAA